MRFLVAGAGIGGLTASIALARQGHSVQVLEQAPEPKPVGAGISLQPNAMFALGTLGLDRAVSQRGCSAACARLRFSDGSLVREFDFSKYKQRYSYLPHTIHRADLFDFLAEAATHEGVDICFGQSVQSFAMDAREVEVSTDQATHRADALIGADGINSRVRAQLWGQTPTRFSGYVCWRGIASDLSVVEQVETMNEVWGKAARFGFMRCSLDKVYWFATRSSPTRDRLSEAWKETFDDWPAPIPELLRVTPESQITFNDISDRKPIFPWSRGRVTLLGDAAHPMTPNFGQGGAQAIEDAIVLASAVKNTESVESAFRAYEIHRHPRAKKFVNASRQFGRIAQGGNVLARFVRRFLLPLTPDSVMQHQLDDQFMIDDHLRWDETE